MSLKMIFATPVPAMKATMAGGDLLAPRGVEREHAPLLRQAVGQRPADALHGAEERERHGPAGANPDVLRCGNKFAIVCNLFCGSMVAGAT